MKIISSHNTYTKGDLEIIENIVFNMTQMLEKAKIIIPDTFPLEISHHYGLDHFNKYGNITIPIINRAYCKKIIILFSQQQHPSHMHKIKEETFHILSGTLQLTVNDVKNCLNPGELYTISQGIPHSFYSETGCIFEEISTTHNLNDSYYADNNITLNQERKTFIVNWKKGGIQS